MKAVDFSSDALRISKSPSVKLTSSAMSPASSSKLKFGIARLLEHDHQTNLSVSSESVETNASLPHSSPSQHLDRPYESSLYSFVSPHLPLQSPSLASVNQWYAAMHFQMEHQLQLASRGQFKPLLDYFSSTPGQSHQIADFGLVPGMNGLHLQSSHQSYSPSLSSHESVAIGRKRTWSRAVFSQLQRKGLEKRFAIHKYITKPDRRKLADSLGLSDSQVKVWFQNRRMKWRHSAEYRADVASGNAPSLAQTPATKSSSNRGKKLQSKL